MHVLARPLGVIIFLVLRNDLPGVGNEARDSLKGNHRGWFVAVIP